MESKGAKMVLSVYDHYKRGVESPKVKDWELVAISPTAGAWKNDKARTYAYAYRGMLTPEDVKTVPTLVSNKFSLTSRYKKDKEFTKQHQPPRGYRRVAFGHSLGGVVVDNILADGLADTGMTYNPAIELSKINNSGNVRYYNRNDFLYKLVGQYASNIKTLHNDYFSKLSDGLDFFNVAKSYYEHNIEQFVDKEKEEEKEVVPKEEVPKEEVKDINDSPKSYIIQSVILDKSAFPTLDKAKEWISLHHYKYIKSDETPNEWRFRQLSPDIFKFGHYEAKTVPLKDVGKLIIAYKV
jgi:hypothetical protein